MNDPVLFKDRNTTKDKHQNNLDLADFSNNTKIAKGINNIDA
jgi:hypothetical protein